MMLALFLYTFECISVTAFSAIMYQFYHFEKYRWFIKNSNIWFFKYFLKKKTETHWDLKRNLIFWILKFRSLLSFPLKDVTFNFWSSREFLKHFVEEYFSYLPFIEGFYGVVVLMVISVIIVVLLSSVLIVTYYKKLHPRLNMFSVYSNASKEMVEDTVHNVGLLLTTTSSNSEEPQTEERTAEYFV